MMRSIFSFSRLVGFCIVAGFSANCSTANATTYTLTPLDSSIGFLGGTALGINDAGLVVGGAAGQHSFVYDSVNHLYQTFDYPAAGATTSASGINDSGLVVGTYTNGNEHHGFTYNVATGIYSSIDEPDAFSPGATLANGINSYGDIVGDFQGQSCIGQCSFVYHTNTGSFSRFSYPGLGTFMSSWGLNSAGVVAGYYQNGSTFSGMRYDGANFTTIEPPAASIQFSRAYGINEAGDIVGQYVTAGVDHGFIYSQGAYETLDIAGDPDTIILSISNHGLLIISGVTGQFVATPVPAPSAALLAASALAVLGCRRRVRPAAPPAPCRRVSRGARFSAS